MNNTTNFKAVVAQVKLQYNLVDYVQQSGISLKQHGMKWKGLCPFHTEKTPSFTVDEHFQNYRCFGCGAHGDILSFVEKYEHLDFFEALRKLAEDKGIALEIGNNQDNIDYKSLRSCVRDAANFFYKEFRKLPNNHIAREEIRSRGLNENTFLYGYAPEGRQTLYRKLKSLGYSDETISKAGVCGKSEKGVFYDLWQGRLMFFVTDITGKPIGFSGRKLQETDRMGKYVNSPETPLYNKSSSLFNVAKAKTSAHETKTLYVAEGQFDVVALVESGIPNVVASLGTAFTEGQGALCRRLVTNQGRIVFCFDGDAAGREAAYKVFQAVPNIHDQAYVVSFPNNSDPCDYYMEHGSEKLKQYVENSAVPLVEFVLSMTAANFDLSTPLGRSSYVESAASILRAVANIPLREQFVRQVSLNSLTSIDTVQEAVNKATPVIKHYVPSADVAKETRPEFDSTDVDEETLIHHIKTNNIYSASARLIVLTLMEPRFLPSLIKAKTLLVSELRSIVDEMEHLMAENQVVVPEQFMLTKVMDFLVGGNLFPLAQIMTESTLKTQFKYVRHYLRQQDRKRVEDEVRNRVFDILAKSPNASVDFLEQALAKEKKELSHVNMI